MLKFETLVHENSEGGQIGKVYRAKVPGGWLVVVKSADFVTSFFYPDSRHEWDGSSLR